MNWRIHHRAETASTNVDARGGSHGDVFTADFQSAGRGRLDHKWLSPPKTNLMMSVVLSVEGLSPEHISTLPLVIGLSACKAIHSLLSLRHPCAPFAAINKVLATKGAQGGHGEILLKWTNDVLIDGKKIAGILCERNGDNVIAGIGINVNQTEFPPEIAERATSLSLIAGKRRPRRFMEKDEIVLVRDAILAELASCYLLWRAAGFAAVYPEIAAVDFLKGREIAVRQTDDDSAPIAGVSNGIMPDGSLDVGGTRAYAGEAHVERI